MNLANMTAALIKKLFRLGPPYVQTVTYIRPASFSAAGTVEANEVRVPAQAIIPARAPAGIWTEARRLDVAVINISSADLTSVAPCKPGDFILLTDGTRFDVKQARLDPTDVLWTFQCRESNSEDRGDLTTQTASDDYGDLTGYTSAEDWGALYNI
jgi:hypothetical protein